MATDTPIPLVTSTWTTDEMAMTVAGLNLLRRSWSQKALDAGVLGHESDRTYALGIVERISDFINRVSGAVSEEQGSALLSELINELRRKR